MSNKPPKLHRRTVSAAALLATSAILISPAPAVAQERAPQEPEITAERIPFSELNIDQSPSENLEAVSLALDNADRSARGVEADELNYAVIDDPTRPGGEIEVVWDDGIIPASVDVAYADFGEDGGQSGIGVLIEEDPEAIAGKTAPSSTDTPIAIPDNMYLDHRFCLDFFYEPAYPADQDAPSTNQEHHLTTCYEKFAESGTNLWGYYRRAIWTNAVGSEVLYRPRLVDFSARTQPWNGTEGSVDRMVDWAPISPESACTPGASVTIGAAGTGLTFPTTDCQDTWIDAIPNQGKLGQIFEGELRRQKTLDYGMLFEADNSSVVPRLSDYAWAEVNHRGPQGTTVEDFTLWTDLGWVPW
ncbi:hypothetical protein ACQEU5_21550 [Marinactinospora thermotolerans]|uniref:hypothetical protein n=1 Tax=Marinactinospora thermotolerans TaxID=531310 RepID=UPI003D914BF9